MLELGLQNNLVSPWFVTQPQQHYTRVTVSVTDAASWGGLLQDAVRRCYATDTYLLQRAQTTQLAPAQILASKLPDPGPVMSGDFGEILAYIFLASREGTTVAAGPKKWRLKETRTKAAPYSDVVQFVFHSWPVPNDQDRVICAEVKAKATNGASTPIPDALAGSQNDRTSRLAKTLVWLRDRAIGEDIGVVTVQELNRFIHATEHPQYAREHHAIAIICSGLVDAELATLVPQDIPEGCAVVVVSVPNLHQTYTTVYENVRNSVAQWALPVSVEP
ncbi:MULTISPECIES: Hachiman antiphage defense system protein HamA [Acidobacteriaceae]|uniref:Hachiman antiphage defense system protein HamA n=1 Tax=Acidobacteriaceae TaxID=204434 RepID=UPI00131C0E84|nr:MULTISPECIES: DUF1837 domain-containing protein [Acidobacteriaceae]MDW5266092.1 hypothetical protein [Edaphobacter sp.]